MMLSLGVGGQNRFQGRRFQLWFLPLEIPSSQFTRPKTSIVRGKTDEDYLWMDTHRGLSSASWDYTRLTWLQIFGVGEIEIIDMLWLEGWWKLYRTRKNWIYTASHWVWLWIGAKNLGFGSNVRNVLYHLVIKHGWLETSTLSSRISQATFDYQKAWHNPKKCESFHMCCPFYPPMGKSSLLFAGTMSTKGDSSGAFQLKHRSGTANVFNEEVMTHAALRLGLVKPSWLSPCQPPWKEGRWFKKLLVWVCLNMNYPFLFHVLMLSQWLSFSVSSYLFCVFSYV